MGIRKGKSPQNEKFSEAFRIMVRKTPEAGNAISIPFEEPTNNRAIMVYATNSTSLTDGDPWYIQSNDISGYIEGIHMANLYNHYKWLAANTIEIDPLPKTKFDTGRVRNNAGIHQVNVSGTVVESNELSGALGPNAPQEPYIHRGYVGEEIGLYTLKCNDIHDIGEAFFFYNQCTGYNDIAINDFIYPYHRGVVLSHGGQIGQHGEDFSSTTKTDLPSNNTWGLSPVDVTDGGGGTRTGYATYSQLTSNPGPNSLFYVRPTPPGHDPPPALESRLTANSEVVKTVPVDNPPSATPLCPEIEEIQLQEPGENKEEVIRDIAGDSLDYGYAPTGSRWWSVYHAYRMIKGDSSLPGSDSLLIAFEDSVDQANLGSCREVDEKREAGNVTQASSTNNSIVCGTPWDSTLKAFNKIYLESWGRDSAITQNHLKDLWELAQKCPITHGPGVYRSRSLLHHITDTTLQFKGDCPAPESPDQEKMRTNDNGNTVEASWAPNPAQNTSVLTYDLGERNAGAKIILRNVRGEVVERSSLDHVKGRERFDLEGAKNGLYFYEIRKDGDRLKTGKLMLIR